MPRAMPAIRWPLGNSTSGSTNRTGALSEPRRRLLVHVQDARQEAPCAHSHPRLCNHGPELRHHCANHRNDPKHPHRSGADRRRWTSPHLRSEFRQPSDGTQGPDWSSHCPIVSAQDEAGSSSRLVCACVERRLSFFHARLCPRQLTTHQRRSRTAAWGQGSPPCRAAGHRRRHHILTSARNTHGSSDSP